MPRWIVSIALVCVCVLGAGCATTLDQREVGFAQQQADAPGFNGRYFQDSPYFIFCGRPTEGGLAYLKEQGVGTVVNLRTDQEMAEVPFDEAEVVRTLGMNYVRIPVSGSTFSVQTVDEFAAVLESTREPIAVHCASSNRVGGLWAAYLVLHRGMPIEEAIERGKAAGLGSFEDTVRSVLAEVRGERTS